MLLSNSIWWTRQARIRTERRLLSNGFHSQVILLWYSFYSVAVSIFYLNMDNVSPLANKFWIIYSVLVLVVSGFISGFSFKERANLIKDNYEYLKNLYSKAKELEDLNQSTLAVEVDYEVTLKKCENHQAEDYIIALCDEYYSAVNKNDLSKEPTRYQVLKAICYKLKRFFQLAFLYILPIGINLFLNSFQINDKTIQVLFML